MKANDFEQSLEEEDEGLSGGYPILKLSQHIMQQVKAPFKEETEPYIMALCEYYMRIIHGLSSRAIEYFNKRYGLVEELMKTKPADFLQKLEKKLPKSWGREGLFGGCVHPLFDPEYSKHAGQEIGVPWVRVFN